MQLTINFVPIKKSVFHKCTLLQIAIYFLIVQEIEQELKENYNILIS